MQNAQAQAAQARADQTGAITGMFGSLASIGGSLMASKAGGSSKTSSSGGFKNPGIKIPTSVMG
jgi:hypothetical protein